MSFFPSCSRRLSLSSKPALHQHLISDCDRWELDFLFHLLSPPWILNEFSLSQITDSRLSDFPEGFWPATHTLCQLWYQSGFCNAEIRNSPVLISTGKGSLGNNWSRSQDPLEERTSDTGKETRRAGCRLTNSCRFACDAPDRHADSAMRGKSPSPWQAGMGGALGCSESPVRAAGAAWVYRHCHLPWILQTVTNPTVAAFLKLPCYLNLKQSY